jgi:uncharacterized cofD-like protein
MTLVAEDSEGKKIIGESSINRCKPPLKNLWLEPPDAEPLPEAVLSILQADVIILAPGSLYTSTITNLLFPEIRTAIEQSGAPLLYVANLVAESKESFGLQLSDHLDAIQRFGGIKLSAVLANDTPLCSPVLAKYAEEGGVQLFVDEHFEYNTAIVKAPLLDEDSDQARHSPRLLNEAIKKCLIGLESPKA